MTSTHSIKVGPNDLCPCWSGKKYKHCCRGKIDWEQVLRSGRDHLDLMSIRGRNLLFVEAIHEALQLDKEVNAASLAEYKRAFTAEAVRKIYEAVYDLWPPSTDIQSLLERAGADVSGLYIGDYDPHYVSAALVRHSIYANKILLVDPFQHPYILKPEYNPIENPAQYRAQTLRNVNFYLSLLPWMDAGIVEFVRTPADFDRELNYETMVRSRQASRDEPELKAAIAISVRDLKQRHMRKQAFQDLILGAPESRLRRIYKDVGLSGKMTEADFIEQINAFRDADPDFLEPLGTGEQNAQLRMSSTGGTYEMARLTAQMSRSYLFTDLHARWAAIQYDRGKQTAENAVWSPFAKAVQNTKLYYLNNLTLDHAFRLRTENRLEGVRNVMTEAWDKARTEEPFDERNAVELANRLNNAVSEAESEWQDIKADMVKYGGASLTGGGILSVGAAIAAGQAAFVAAAAFVGTAAFGAWTKFKKAAYIKKYPAAFFMDLSKE